MLGEPDERVSLVESLSIRTLLLVAGVALGAGVAASCGGSTPSAPSPPAVSAPPTPPSPTPPPAPLTAQVTITASGVAPKEVTVAQGGIVTFVNSDTRVHDIFSDPDHLGTDCPAINEAGFLQIGQRRDTGPLTTIRRCGYHDHLNTNDEAMRGTIIVVAVP